MSIVETSLKRPLLIVVIFTVLTLGGFISYRMLNLDLLPKFELSTLTVATIYPGAGASEVETSVTKKIEDALSTIENLKKITSTSQEGISIVVIELNEGSDANIAVQDAQRKINAIKSDLPIEILDPSIDKISLDELPIMQVAATSSLPSTQFFKLVEDRIQPRLAKLTGVGTVNMVGGTEREIKVNINVDKLKAYNLSILQVLQAIQSANIEIPAGNVENTTAIYSVRLVAKFNSLDQLRNTVIMTTANGGKVKVLDVAEVEDGIKDQKLINRIDGRDAIGLSIQKQTDANAVSVSDLAKLELAAIEKEYADDGVKFEIASDNSVYTRASSNAVVIDLILAILIVAVVCFVFLHNIRSALIVMVAVPLSIIPAFIALYVFGYSLNMMSLMALSLVVGILVDDSIVVIENMVRHMEMGKSRRKAALEGCKQIMFTVMAITLVIVVVFLPLAISGGLIGNILKEFAIPIIAATLCSLLVSFTVTPLLVSRFAKIPEENNKTLLGRFSIMVEHSFESLKKWYGKTLSAGLRNKTLVLSVAVVLFFGSFSLLAMGMIGFAFVPTTDQGEFMVSLDMNPQVTTYQNNLITKKVEAIIEAKPEVERVYTNVGSTGAMFGNSSKNNASTISVKMVGKDKRNVSVDEFAEQVKEEIMQMAGIRARVSAISLGGGGEGNEPIQLIVQGADFEEVQKTAHVLLEVVKKTPGASDAKFSIDDPRQEVQVELDREKIAELGLSINEVGAAMRVALNGNDDSKYTEGNFEYDINVRLDGFDRTRIEDVQRLTFMSNRGKLIELKQIAKVGYGLGPSTLERNNRIASITVRSNVVGRATGTVGQEILETMKGKVPEGVTLKAAGMMEQQGDAFGSLGFAFLAAIVMIYLIMVALYDSLLDPIVVLFAIPLAIIGALLALALTMNDLTIFSIIGIITLIGLVAKNAILLVDFTNHLRSEGYSTLDALIEAGEERLRPILMTTFAMVFGMLPIALAAGDGAEMKNGMAWVIIGGLLSSMVLTLLVIPVIYYIFDRISTRLRRYGRNKAVQRIKAKWLKESLD